MLAFLNWNRSRFPILSGLSLAAGSAWAAGEPVAPVASSSVAAWQVLTILGYLGVLGLLSVVGVRWWKTRGGALPAGLRARQIQVVEVRRVSPSTSIVLADIRGRPYVIVCSGSAVTIQPLPEGGA